MRDHVSLIHLIAFKPLKRKLKSFGENNKKYILLMYDIVCGNGI